MFSLLKRIQTFLPICLVLLALPITAQASGSWVWTSETQPWNLLPFFVIGALMAAPMIFFGVSGYQKKGRGFGVFYLGTLAIFLLPYLLRYVGGSYQISAVGDHYIVDIFFLIAVVVVMAVQYPLLKQEGVQTKRLLSGVLLANLVCVGGVALIERLACPGFWV